MREESCDLSISATAIGARCSEPGITVAEEYTDTVKANTINASIALSPSRLRSSLTPRL